MKWPCRIYFLLRCIIISVKPLAWWIIWYLKCFIYVHKYVWGVCYKTPFNCTSNRYKKDKVLKFFFFAILPIQIINEPDSSYRTQIQLQHNLLTPNWFALGFVLPLSVISVHDESFLICINLYLYFSWLFKPKWNKNCKTYLSYIANTRAASAMAKQTTGTSPGIIVT